MRVKRTLCRACGAPKVTRPTTGYVPCAHCGKPLSWPVGKTTLACPACKMEQRALANPYEAH